MSSGSPSSTQGSGGRLAAELHSKADLGESNVNKRDDLRVAALENYASQKAQRLEGFPLIRAANMQYSPNKTSSTMGSDHTMVASDLPLKRQGSATFSTGAIPRSSRSSSPTKRAATAVLERYHEIIAQPTAQEAQPRGDAFTAFTAKDEPNGLDFLLQACDILEPGATEPTSFHSGRHTATHTTNQSTCSDQELITSRGRRSRRPSDETEYDYTPNHSSEDDDEYRPVRRANGRPVRRVAAVAARPATVTVVVAARVDRGFISGPCTNPDCEHPYDSPQWRKGPPTNPVLCNACGTRWLRNGTLKPLVPRRGIRYGKARPKGSVKAAAEARAEAAAARVARKEAAEAELKMRSQEQEVMAAQEWNNGDNEDEFIVIDDGPSSPAPATRAPVLAAAPNPVSVSAVPVLAPAAAPVLVPALLPASAPASVENDQAQALYNAMAAAAAATNNNNNSANMHNMHGILQQMAADPAAFQQQIAAMAAMAEAAQNAFAAAQAAMLSHNSQEQAGKYAAQAAQGPRRPVFNIQAFAGPQVAAPRYEAPQPMQEDR